MVSTRKMIQNILRVANSAHPSSIQEGLQWYSEAANIAESLGGGLIAGAGVLAALSPNKSWVENIRLASLGTQTNHFGGTFAPACRKADAIWNKKMDPTLILKGRKERAFYYGIINRGRTLVVCVDRHAASVAYNKELSNKEAKLNKTEYERIANAYRSAAYESTEKWWPAQLQAITWVEWRKRK